MVCEIIAAGLPQGILSAVRKMQRQKNRVFARISHNVYSRGLM